MPSRTGVVAILAGGFCLAVAYGTGGDGNVTTSETWLNYAVAVVCIFAVIATAVSERRK